MSLESLVGQQLMIGIPDDSITPRALSLFRETHAGGLIVYRPNFRSARDFKKMISDFESSLGRRLLIAVDHEGGRVVHLGESVTVFPDNLTFGHAAKEEYVRAQGEIEARELRALGIDLNLAPTLDVLTPAFSPNIGIRSYSTDPDKVSSFGAARIRAMQANGLSACAKHFPGQGHSSIDAHLGLPVLSSSAAEMKKVHFPPFEAAIRAGVDTVMSSHPVYPGLGGTKQPATFSREIITGLLRNELGFRGVILSDDLEMGALKNFGSVGVSARRAVEAGHDIVLICHDESAVRESYKTLLDAYRNGELQVKDLEESCRRIEALKNKRPKRFEEHVHDGRGRELARKAAAEGVHFYGDFKWEFDPAAKCCVIFPKISSLKDLIHIESEYLDEAAHLRSYIGKKGISAEIHIVPFDPEEAEIDRVLATAKSCGAVLFFCYDAHLFAGCRRLLGRLQDISKPLAVALLRDPYDREYVRVEFPVVTAFGFRSSQVEAVLDRLFSKKTIPVVTS